MQIGNYKITVKSAHLRQIRELKIKKIKLAKNMLVGPFEGSKHETDTHTK